MLILSNNLLEFHLGIIPQCSLRIIRRIIVDLVSATVTEITVIIFRCTTEVINIERAAVSHLNVGEPEATV